MFVEYINSRNNFELTGSGIDSFRSRTKRFYRRWIIISNKTRYLISSNLINKLYIACTLNFKHYLRLHIPWRNKMSILIARSNIYYTFFKIIISFSLDRQKSLLFNNLKGLKITAIRSLSRQRIGREKKGGAYKSSESKPKWKNDESPRKPNPCPQWRQWFRPVKENGTIYLSTAQEISYSPHAVAFRHSYPRGQPYGTKAGW